MKSRTRPALRAVPPAQVQLTLPIEGPQVLPVEVEDVKDVKESGPKCELRCFEHEVRVPSRIMPWLGWPQRDRHRPRPELAMLIDEVNDSESDLL